MQCVCECGNVNSGLFRIHYHGGVFIASCAGCDKVATEWKEGQATGSEPMEEPEEGIQQDLSAGIPAEATGEAERVIGVPSAPRPPILNEKHRMAFEKRREYMRNYMQKRRDKRKAEKMTPRGREENAFIGDMLAKELTKLEGSFEQIDGLTHPVNSL